MIYMDGIVPAAVGILIILGKTPNLTISMKIWGMRRNVWSMPVGTKYCKI